MKLRLHPLHVLKVAVFAVLAAAHGAGLAAAQEHCGKQLYAKYCAACHGTDAKGKGPLAPHLIPEPNDLTQLAKARGGKYPFSETVRAIDGRKTIGAHGTTAMPVWGEVFRTDPDADLMEQVRSKGEILCVTEYLETIQAK